MGEAADHRLRCNLLCPEGCARESCAQHRWLLARLPRTGSAVRGAWVHLAAGYVFLPACQPGASAGEHADIVDVRIAGRTGLGIETFLGVLSILRGGGRLFGFLYIKLLPKKGLLFGASERYFSLRNSYYRWKRRRAARKFEVYMREHDRNVTFDEYGNYVPPDEKKKNGGSKSGWVN